VSVKCIGLQLIEN